MTRALTDGRPARRHSGGHPDWCEGGHHCTALTLPTGEHASRPEIWLTDVGRFIGTRYRDGRDHMELRIVLNLDDHDDIAQAQCRHLMALAYKVVCRAFGRSEGAGAR
ncbi:hypothetical protein [Catellatospora sp. NPDC049609]|uniref:hypothetical protein n=1 Tax=Catellatospora sp. NPDC049609 TaxID=3155505 RepID=UPI00341784DF